MILFLKVQNLWPKLCCLLGLFGTQLLHCSEARNKHRRLAGFSAPQSLPLLDLHGSTLATVALKDTERQGEERAREHDTPSKYKFMDKSLITTWSSQKGFFVKSPGHRPQMLSSLSNSDSGPLRHSSSRLKSSMLAALSNISWRCHEVIPFYSTVWVNLPLVIRKETGG